MMKRSPNRRRSQGQCLKELLGNRSQNVSTIYIDPCFFFCNDALSDRGYNFQFYFISNGRQARLLSQLFTRNEEK